jgi:N-acetyl-anhydromuramyl-L-alanine amidase AmpD
MFCGLVSSVSAVADGGLETGSAGLRAEQVLAAHLRGEEQRLRDERLPYPSYFKHAYQRYPGIPQGTLEAIAYVQSRWHHMIPSQDAVNADHHHMPSAFGVMGLYDGNGFADQVNEAAALLETSSERVKNDPATNVLAAAALLDRVLSGKSVRDIEDIAPALAAYAGFSPQSLRIDTFARASFAFDVLLTIDRGVDEKGVVVPERAVRWEQAFEPDMLVKLNAPFVRLDIEGDRIDTKDYELDPISEQLRRRDASGAEEKSSDAQILSTDYGPAIWDPANSTNYNASRTASVSAVTIHTAQGSYAGTISWFKNSAASVSAHYVIRSSDGQVTQMVRNAHTAWHVRNHNSYTLGIEHEGYVDNSAWYTTAMYSASSALVRSFCATYGAISCASAYSGASSSGISVLADSVKIKGHQHYSGQTHTDPGINWNWGTYYALLNPGSSGTTQILDSFESSAGHFDTSPAYSGSTTGISTSSAATRYCSMAKNGSCSLQVYLVDNASGTADWAVRLLSGSGTPSANTSLTRANGHVGFWVYTSATGMSAALGIDDSDGTERSISRAIPVSTWTYLEWSLTDTAQWSAWVGGNGAITASSVTLDAIWFYRAKTSYPVYLYVDDVQIRN